MTTVDRRPYLTATDLTQDLLDEMADNLNGKIEMVAHIKTPDGGTIYVSDRHKYVGGQFYTALIQNMPLISKTIGEWLVPGITFSAISLEVSNVDGRFNNYLPAGDDYLNWVGLDVTILIGIDDIASSYKTIFEGFITEVGGMGRTTKTLNFTARDRYDTINESFPTVTFSNSEYPFIEDSLIGTLKPMILGNWTQFNNRTPAQIPAFVVNGADPNVQDAPRNNVKLVISETVNQFFINGGCYYKVDDNNYALVPSTEIVNVNGDKNYFEVLQDTAVEWFPTGDEAIPFGPYEYSSGDEFLVQVVGVDIGGVGFDDNIVAQAKHILLTYTPLVPADFDANWETYRTKAAPAQSAISTFISRVWVQDAQGALEYALQLLEQVRLELFIERENLNVKLKSLHFEDFAASPSYTLKNWDVARDSLSIAISDTTVFNRLQGDFDFNPSLDGNNFKTSIFRNQASIDATKPIAKGVFFPNLVDRTVCNLQITEILRLASSQFEVLDLQVTWRSLLLDIGQDVKFDVKIGSSLFDNVVCTVRDIGYSPSGVVTLKLWSYQMTPFPGYVPGYPGTVGGYDAVILEE